MDKISLTASMRSNLLSLQNISGQVSLTQNKLSTGNKVNSAIDNPSSYYTALSLNNRADDLNALLDSMGQAVSTIKAATTALESATEFLEQASAVATQALETAKIPSKSFFEEKVGENGAVVTTAQELKDAVAAGKETICVYGIIDYFDEELRLQEGQKLVGTEYFTGYTGKERFSKLNLTNVLVSGKDGLLSDLTINSELISYNYAITAADGTTLNNIDLFSIKTDNSFSAGILLQAKNHTLNLTGKININHQCQTGSGIYIFNGAIVNSSADLTVTSESYGGIFVNADSSTFNITKGRITTNRLRIDTGTFNLEQSAELNSLGNISLVRANLNIAGRLNILNKTTSAIFTATASATASSSINIASTAEITAYGEGNLFSLDAQSSATIAAGSKFNLNLDGGQIAYLTATEDSTWTNSSGTTVSLQNLLDSGKFKDNTSATKIDWDNWNPSEEDEETDNSETETQQSFSQYQEIINQYNALIKDAGYKGINLLQTDKLTVKFNEDNSSALEVTGKDMSPKALGFTVMEWQTQGDIERAIEELSTAMQATRNYSSELGNNYSIITTRQDFTNSLINVLTEGADKLTLADMNEESANMLALQTRQQLAINSLSLASQASQSILKLF